MGFNVKQLLNDISINYKSEEYKHKGSSCIKYKLAHCVFDKSHTNNDACIFQYKNGNLNYKCFHDSCKDKTWKNVRVFVKSEYGINLKKYWPTFLNSKKETEDLPLKFETFYDICEKPVKRKSIISGFMDEGDQVIISGSGGVGKSMLIFYIAYFLANFKKIESSETNIKKIIESNLFQKFPIPKQRASLFIQSENNRNQINIRLNKMAMDNPDNKNAFKRIITPTIRNDVLTTGKTFQDGKFQQWAIDLIRKIEDEKGFKLDLLFIDPLISFISEDENKSASMRKDLDGITNIAHTAKITPVVIHHHKKDDSQYRGSSAIFDWTRNMISLTSKKNSSDKSKSSIEKIIEVKHAKCNNFEMFKPFNIRKKKNNTFELVDGVISPEIADQCNLVREALEHLNEKTESQNELAKVYEELSGHSLSTAKRHIAKAVDEGFINRIEIQGNKKGEKKKRKNFLYTLEKMVKKDENDNDQA